MAFLGFDASFSNVGVGVGGVDGFYGSFPEVEPVGVVVDGHEDVVGDFVADGDGGVGWVGVGEGFSCGEFSSEEIVPVCVGGASEVVAVEDEDVPDGDGLFDGGVFLV